MPGVFEKDSKLNLIEYGDHCFEPLTLKGIWQAIRSFFRAN
jgi:hypothetical protein